MPVLFLGKQRMRLGLRSEVLKPTHAMNAHDILQVERFMKVSVKVNPKQCFVSTPGS